MLMMDVDDDPCLQRLKSRLEPYPHSLQVDHMLYLTQRKCQDKLQTLETEDAKPCGYEEEVLKKDNFISLLYFRLGREDEAFEINSKIRTDYPSNLTALINYVFMKTVSKIEDDVEAGMRKLREMKGREDYTHLLVSAKAEQAYSMARIAPFLYVKATDLYEECINMEPNNYLWKFGCALTYRRCLGAPRNVKNMTQARVQHFCEKAVEYLSDIIRRCKTQRLLVKAWVELGQLYLSFQNPAYPLTNQIVGSLKTHGISVTAEQCFDTALGFEETQRDEFVLSTCGKCLLYARSNCNYITKLRECHTLLSRAYDIRPTTMICDTLAKILIKMTSTNKEQDYKRERGTLSIPKWQYRSFFAEKPREEESSRRKRLEHDSHQDNASKFFYSPETVQTYTAGHPLLDEAKGYLQQSIAMSKQSDANAIYTLGLLYRRLGQSEAAVEQFKLVISDPSRTLFYKTLCFEQIGFCLLEMSENSQYSEIQRQAYREESKLMMLSSIEMSATLVASTPTMEADDIKFSKAVPALKQLLTSDHQAGHSTRDIARLCDMVQGNGDSLLQLHHSNHENPSFLCRIIERNMQQREFQTALISIRLLMCTQEGQKMANQDLVYQVYLGIVKHLLYSEETEINTNIIRSCFQSAFAYKHRLPSGETIRIWDAYVLDDPDQTEREAAAVCSWLKNTCGLFITRNKDEVGKGTLEIAAQRNIMKNSSCLLFVLGSKDIKQLKEFMKYAASLTTKDGKPKIIVPVCTAVRKLPSPLAGRQAVMLSGRNRKEDLLECFMAMLEMEYSSFEWIT